MRRKLAIGALEESLRNIQKIIDKANGRPSSCAIMNIPPEIETYLETWVKPRIMEALHELKRKRRMTDGRFVVL